MNYKEKKKVINSILIIQKIFMFRRKMNKYLLDSLEVTSNFIFKITEQLHQCFIYKIRNQSIYNELMNTLEVISKDCVSVKNQIYNYLTINLTLKIFIKLKDKINEIKKKLKILYYYQGAFKISDVLDLEFNVNSNILQKSNIELWWLSFLDTTFVPLNVIVYKMYKGKIVSNNIPQNKFFIVNYKNNLELTQYCSSIHAEHKKNLKQDKSRIEYILHEHCYPPYKHCFLNNNKKKNISALSLSQVNNNSNSDISLIEYIHGARVYAKIDKNIFNLDSNYVIVMNGYFKNDSFQLASCHTFMSKKYSQLYNNIKKCTIFSNKTNTFNFGIQWMKQLSLRDMVVYDLNELVEKCISDYQLLQQLKSRTISNLVKDFLSSPLYIQREILTLFLLTDQDSDTQYLAYLMYDMISQESYLLKPQPLAEEIYNHLHWNIKKRFKVVIENISNFTKKITNFNETDINYESRIYLMKCDDGIKKKAMEKLKEIQSKNGNDNSHKAQQYLDGLLRIPFNIYKKELIFSFLDEFRNKLKIHCDQVCQTINNKESYQNIYNNYKLFFHNSFVTSNCISSFLNNTTFEFNDIIKKEQYSWNLELLKKYFKTFSYDEICLKLNELKKILSCKTLEYSKEGSQIKKKIRVKKKINNKYTKTDLTSLIENIIDFCKYLYQQKKENWIKIVDSIPGKYKSNSLKTINLFYNQILNFDSEWNHFKLDAKQYMTDVDSILEKSVFGHENAKRGIKQVIAQWITGELKGYCFGFEGPPGTGKTSLAKNGISKCLIDINGEKRPFSFIALGGSSNGSTLEGHSYTYVGSIWGRIVDILMESKCMNPIIYIDELDKVSKTEHGKEIIGILTHLTDSTQNDEFIDKYFGGIKLDLSKVLFIFSYNDPDLIDPILRDRIHIIRFSPLKQKDKHQVCTLHLIPEILRTVGLSKTDIIIPQEIIDFIIDHYTREGGVRRLKEKLFEICRDLNIRHMTDPETYAFPYTVTIDFLKNDLFIKHPIIQNKMILKSPRIGLTNGMYASALGVGGITIIECFIVPKTSFMSLELTGHQGNVMKESMSVAKTVAWNLLTKLTKNELHEESKTNSFGLHLHCPDGGTPKDGPSAGAAITISIVSCLLKIPVNNLVSMTGEIDLNGQVCQIGGLETKIRGAKKAGVKKVLVPKSNEHDMIYILQNDPPFDNSFEFVYVENIWDVIPHVFPDSEYDFVKF